MIRGGRTAEAGAWTRSTLSRNRDLCLGGDPPSWETGLDTRKQYLLHTKSGPIAGEAMEPMSSWSPYCPPLGWRLSTCAGEELERREEQNRLHGRRRVCVVDNLDGCIRHADSGVHDDVTRLYTASDPPQPAPRAEYDSRQAIKLASHDSYFLLISVNPCMGARHNESPDGPNKRQNRKMMILYRSCPVTCPSRLSVASAFCCRPGHSNSHA